MFKLSNKNIKSEVIDKIIYNIEDDLRGRVVSMSTILSLVKLEIDRFKDQGLGEVDQKDGFIIVHMLETKKLIYKKK